jgi:hypothetical protein
VIENNPNKDLIISMSIKHGFKVTKKEKRKRDPPIRIDSNGLLLEK